MFLPFVIAVFSIFCGWSMYGRARAARKNPWAWGVGVAVGYFVATWLAVYIVGLIAGSLVPFFGMVAAQLVAAYVMLVIVGATVCDRLSAQRLGY